MTVKKIDITKEKQKIINKILSLNVKTEGLEAQLVKLSAEEDELNALLGNNEKIIKIIEERLAKGTTTQEG